MRLLSLLKEKLFRLSEMEATPIHLNQRRIFILPTRGGLLFAVVAFTMLLAAINYNLSLGYLLVFMVVSLGIVGMIHTFRNLLGLELTPLGASPVFAGEIARFPLQIKNPQRFPRLALSLNFENEAASFIHELKPNELTETKLAITSVQRGHLSVGKITLSTNFPLGLFRAWSYPHPEWQCLVYPKPIFAPFPTSFASMREALAGKTSGGDDFSGLREWQNNESLRQIAWKNVARTPEFLPLLTKQFEGDGCIELYFEWEQVTSYLDTETKLSVLAGWIIEAAQQQERYGLRLPTTTIHSAQGEAHYHRCLTTLALYGKD